MREDQVRELLALAGETIEVGPGAEVEASPRRRWPYVAGAAAAAVAIAASVAVAATLGGRDASPGPQSGPAPGQDQVTVAGVYGMPVDIARRELEAQGFQVEVQHEETCREPLGRSLATSPVGGSAVDPGSAIVLAVAYQGSSEGAGADDALQCDGADLLLRRKAWQVVDFANRWVTDVGSHPEITGQVGYWENGADPQGLSAGQATDPASYGILGERLRQQLALPGAWLRAAIDDGRDFACAGLELAPSLQQRPSLWFEISQPHDGPPNECTMVNVFVNGDDVPNGAITDIALRSSDHPLLDELSNDAQASAEGFDVDADAEAVALRFLTATRPESPISLSPYAEQVDLYLGNRFITTLPAGSAHAPASWEVCPGPSGYAEFACPFNAFETASRRTRDQIRMSEGPADSVCLARLDEKPQRDEHLVVLSPREFSMCSQQWFIELYYDEDQRITAVNLLLGSP